MNGAEIVCRIACPEPLVANGGWRIQNRTLKTVGGLLATGAVIPDQPVFVYVSHSFLLEEAILGEAETINADVIVPGKSQNAAWRRVLDRVVGAAPDIVRFLCESTTAEIVVVE